MVASYDSSDDSSSDSVYDTSSVVKISAINEASLFDEGYDDGFEAAVDDYLYDDYKNKFSKNELEIYKKGYFAGYIEGGRGELYEILYYYLIQKYLFITIASAAIIIFGLAWFISKRSQVKRSSDSKNSNQPNVQKNSKAAWIISGVVITSIIGFYLYGNTSETEPANSNKSDNPYEATSIDHNCTDFDTQEDAQFFYEANGGPDEDPHGLDRDNDGTACDWNP